MPTKFWVRLMNLAKKIPVLVLAALIIWYWQLPNGSSVRLWYALLTDAAYAQAELWLGSQTLLYQRAVNAQSQLEEEIDRLRWVEAESSLRAQTLEQDFIRLQESYEQAAEEVNLLSHLAFASPESWVWQDQRLTAPQLAQLTADVTRTRDALASRLELAHQVLMMYRDATHSARTLRLEMQENLAALQVYMEMLKATRLLDKVHGNVGVAQTVWRDPVDIANTLRGQIERNRKLMEQRRHLDDLLAQPFTEQRHD